jgi:hypothetical protein
MNYQARSLALLVILSFLIEHTVQSSPTLYEITDAKLEVYSSEV